MLTGVAHNALFSDVKIGQMFTKDDGALYVKVGNNSTCKVMEDGSWEPSKGGGAKVDYLSGDYYVTLVHPMVFQATDEKELGVCYAKEDQKLFTPVIYDGVMHLEKAEISV